MSTGRGRLWKYAGDSRRKAGVKRKYEKKDKSAAPVDSDEAELFMKESEVAESNESAMVEAFKSSFAVRRKWIKEKKPLFTDIFQRFPRYISRFTTGCEFAYQQILILILFVLQLSDLSFQIKLDFNIVAECDMDAFLSKWLQLQEKIVARLPEKVQRLYLTVVFAEMQCLFVYF